jgi:hypothetical protein
MPNTCKYFHLRACTNIYMEMFTSKVMLNIQTIFTHFAIAINLYVLQGVKKAHLFTSNAIILQSLWSDFKKKLCTLF